MAALLSSFLVFTFLLFSWLLLTFFKGKKDVRKRLDFYLQSEGKSMDAVVHETKARLTLSAKLKRINKSLKSRLTMKRNSDKLVAFLRSAGVHWQPGEYMAFRVIAAIIAAGLLDILHVSWVLPILGAFIGFFYPKLWVSGKRKKTIETV